jgi:hypothetical protein
MRRVASGVQARQGRSKSTTDLRPLAWVNVLTEKLVTGGPRDPFGAFDAGVTGFSRFGRRLRPRRWSVPLEGSGVSSGGVIVIERQPVLSRILVVR